MNTLFSILLPILLITSIFLVHHGNNNKTNRKNYEVVGAFIFIGVILVGVFLLIYNFFGLSLILGISSTLLVLGIILIIVGDMENFGIAGVIVCCLTLFFGFLICGLFIPIEYDYKKLEFYEKCKIEDKYIYMYKDKKLITDKDSDVLYLKQEVNSYHLERPGKVKLVIVKEGDK